MVPIESSQSKRNFKYASAVSLAFATTVALTACSGGGDSSTPSTTPTPTPSPITAPSAPTIGVATPGDTNAIIAFTAPTSNGGAAITSYTATCAKDGVSRTGTGSASPITVTNLVNGVAYGCTVAASNSAGTGLESAAVTVTPTPLVVPSSTAGVECDYNYSAFNTTPSVNAPSNSKWTCTNANRLLAANGLPDHAVGTFPNPNNPNNISAQTVVASYTITPVVTSIMTTLGGPRGAIGYVLNGVKIDADTAGSCNDAGNNCNLAAGGTGMWGIEALGQASFKFGTDTNNAHVQPGGAYHYHGMPEGFITKQNKGSAMTLIAWAADGFPIYARYGYSVATDATSAIKIVKGSYRLKATPDINRPSTTLYPMGAFKQDYEYVAGLGDLDECNGRTGVTPEFPKGIYHYFATDTYPFLQRCVKGVVATNASSPTSGYA